MVVAVHPVGMSLNAFICPSVHLGTRDPRAVNVPAKGGEGATCCIKFTKCGLVSQSPSPNLM